jgi:hypothetical protein
MSEDVTKTCIRLPLPELDGKTWQERFDFIKPILGEPSEVDEWEGEVTYFKYDGYDFVYTYKTNKFAVDKVFKDCVSYEHPGLSMSLADLTDEAEGFAMRFGKRAKDCLVVALTYYNGCDEPVEF